MKTKPTTALFVGLCCIASSMSLSVRAADKMLRSVDVALQDEGLLVGQVVNTSGQALAMTPVVLKANGREIARCETDKQGKFRVGGLKGGTIEIASAGTEGSCRLWAPKTAPPAAQPGLLVVAEGDVVRGQHMLGAGRRVPRNGRGVNGYGGGLLAMMIEHPLVTAGAIGTAIAVPIAVADDDSPSTP